MKFYIHTLGCKVNAYESELMKELLLKEGYILSEEDPDIIIVNTCSVTNVSDNKSLKMVRHFKKEFPNSVLVVCGCSSQNKANVYEDLGIDILLGNRKKSEIVSILKEYFKERKNYVFVDSSRKLPFENMCLDKYKTHTRAFVKIQDGCDNFCSYCVIPLVRGSIRSKEMNVAVDEIKTLVSNGHKEIVLTGIHTGSYGTGLGYDLTDLIHEISKFEGLQRIRISSIEMNELNDKFLNELKNNRKICSHLHIPLQAGSDEILSLMNRKYNLLEFQNKLDQIRKIRKDISITTDVIVGHPYETEDLFLKTLETVKKFDFAKVHVFPYSKRENTKASRMDNQVEESEKKRRSRELVKLSSEQEKRYFEKFIGKKLNVLIEQVNDNYSIGLTDNYLKVKVMSKEEKNEMCPVLLTKYENGYLIGGKITNK